jgi:hypothetical protein
MVITSSDLVLQPRNAKLIVSLFYTSFYATFNLSTAVCCLFTRTAWVNSGYRQSSRLLLEHLRLTLNANH